MDTRNKKTLKKIYIVVVLLGAVSTIIVAIKMNAPQFAGFLVLYPGLIYGIYRLKQQAQKYNRMETAVATVIGYREYRDSDDTLMYQPRFEFTVQGRVYNIRSEISSLATDQLKPGDKVWIRYNPKNPSRAEVDDGGCALTTFLVITCMAIIVVIIGVLHLVFQAESVGEVFSKVWDLFF